MPDEATPSPAADRDPAPGAGLDEWARPVPWAPEPRARRHRRHRHRRWFHVQRPGEVVALAVLAVVVVVLCLEVIHR